MRTGWVPWIVVGVGVAVVVACGTSDSKSGDDSDPKGGSGGADPQGGESSGGTSGRGGSAGRGGSSGDAGAGGDGEGGTNPRGGTGGKGGTSGTSGDAGSDTGGDGGAAGGGEGGGGPTIPSITLTINASQDVHAISPRIYGINSGSALCADAGARFGTCRLGGDPWSTYNWENNASNSGGSTCPENNASLGASSTPAAPVSGLITQADAADAAAVVTIPMLGYVSADKTSSTAPPACDGDVRLTTNYLTTRFKQNRARKGSALASTPDTSDAFVNQDEFVNFVQTAAGSNVPLVFALDNQPELWWGTHVAVHPMQTTYAEVIQKTVEYATMVRDTAPNAEVAGYVGYGYNGFLDLQMAPDRSANGEFLDYFLTQMASAGTTAGKRLVHYLDVHWYPDIWINGERIITESSTPDFVATRVQVSRSLWDSEYVEDSWITNQILGDNPIRLIPWLRQKISTRYPGTKLAFSEWNYGGAAHVSGAVAAADVLGSFGREGVDLAAYKSMTSDDSFVLGAFRAFRNYDGAGAAFGDQSVRATSSDNALASVYASLQSANSAAMVIVAINRSTSEVDASIAVNHTTTYATADVYRVTAASAVPAVAADLVASGANAFAYRMPPLSISVIVPKP